MRHCRRILAPSGGVGGGGVTPTIVSASTRALMPQGIVAVNNIVTFRGFDSSNVLVNNPYIEYWNGWVNAGVTSGIQEVGTGSKTTLQLAFATGVNATLGNTSAGYTQAGASLFPITWNNVLNDSTGFIRKVNNANTPPTFDIKTFAQFVADGGSVSNSGLTGGVASDTIVIPDIYFVRSDPATGATLAPKTFYAIQGNLTKPVKQAPTAGSSSGTTATLTVPSTADYVTGNVVDITGNTPAGYNNSSATITVIDSTHLSYTTTGSNLGALTGFGSVFAYSTASVPQAGTQYFANPFGDIQISTTVSKANPFVLNWGPTGQNVATGFASDGTAIPYPIRVMGTSPQGKKFIGLAGPSTGRGFADNAALGANFSSTGSTIVGTTFTMGALASGYATQGMTLSGGTTIPGTVLGLQTSGTTGGGPGAQFTVSPSQTVASATINGTPEPLGDSQGSLGYKKRALNIAGYSYVSTDVSGTLAATVTASGGDTVRLFMIGGAAAVMTEMGSNDTGQPNYTAFLAQLNPYWLALQSASGGKLVILADMPQTTSTDKWTTTANQSVSGSLAYPSGYMWANYYADLVAGNLPSTGPKAAFIDIDAGVIANNSLMPSLGTPGVFSGLWPANGTPFQYVFDGVHPSSVTYTLMGTYTATQVPAAVGFAP